MGAVYGTAEHVLCWLGAFPEEGGAETKAKHIISFLRRFNSNPREHLRAAHQHLHFGEDVAETADNVALLDSWLGIKQLFDIEYFHRAWIIQEVGLAQKARFYWGTKDTWLDWDDIAKFASFMDANAASIINHLGLKSWVANHINFVWANDENGNPLHNFVDVLHWARVHRSTDPLLASLSLVLTGGFRNSSDSTSGEEQEKQQADLAALILEYERIRLPGQSDGFLTSLSSKDKQLIQTMGDRGSAHQFVQDMTWTSMCRKVFRTSNGYTGLGPRIMRNDDFCVVLLGAVYPMVLRKSDQEFQLIGPALMYGFMDGEAGVLERQGRLQEQVFHII